MNMLSEDNWREIVKYLGLSDALMISTTCKQLKKILCEHVMLTVQMSDYYVGNILISRFRNIRLIIKIRNYTEDPRMWQERLYGMDYRYYVNDEGTTKDFKSLWKEYMQEYHNRKFPYRSRMTPKYVHMPNVVTLDYKRCQPYYIYGMRRTYQLHDGREHPNIKKLDISECSLIIEIHKEYILSMTNLRTLKIKGSLRTRTCIGDNDIKNLTKLRHLTELDVSENDEISDEGISNLTQLKILKIRDMNKNKYWGEKKITNDALKNMKELERLDISGNPNITDDALFRLTKLKVLKINRNNKITDKGLLPLNLEELYYKKNRKITTKGVYNMSRLRRLEPCTSGKVCMTRGLFEQLKNLDMSRIKQLNKIDTNNITNEDLLKLKGLEMLNLNDNRTITNDTLSKIINIKQLSLQKNNIITNDGIRTLKELRMLNIRGNKKILPEILYELPNLKKIEINEHQYNDRTIRELQGHTNINIYESRKKYYCVNRRRTKEYWEAIGRKKK